VRACRLGRAVSPTARETPRNLPIGNVPFGLAHPRRPGLDAHPSRALSFPTLSRAGNHQICDYSALEKHQEKHQRDIKPVQCLAAGAAFAGLFLFIFELAVEKHLKIGRVALEIHQGDHSQHLERKCLKLVVAQSQRSKRGQVKKFWIVSKMIRLRSGSIDGKSNRWGRTRTLISGYDYNLCHMRVSPSLTFATS
jgi:hypothetical protein